MKLAVLGNCQAQILEGLFTAGSPGFAVQCLPPNYTLTEAMADSTLALLDTCDLVLAQRVAADFHLPGLRPAAMRDRLGPRVLTWPNIYFDGYFPGVRYLYLEGWHKVGSPLGEYHLQVVMDCFRRGETAAAATAALCGPLALGAEADPFEASFAALQAREQGLDVRISDFLRAQVLAQPCCFTPNHPRRFVLVEMCRRLAAAAGLPFAEPNGAHELDSIQIPPWPAVVQRYHPGFPAPPRFMGVEVTEVRHGLVQLGGPREYWPAELVEQFYRIYDLALPH